MPRKEDFSFIGIKIDVYLLHLELDGALEVLDLLLHVVSVGQERRELSGLVQSRTQQSGDLLDQRLGSQESVVLLGQLLDQLLLLVQLLEVVGAHEWDALGLGLVAMVLIAEHAHRELGSWGVTQSGRKKRKKTQLTCARRIFVFPKF